MRLAPDGGELSRHADISDPSNERWVLRSWGLDGNTSSMVMRPGTAAYLDVEMLRNATPAPLDSSTEKA
jgi:hypothetical protein